MTEKDFGKALLRGEGVIDSQALTDRILRRDRRRMWVLGIVCVIAWMAVVMLPWATILPMMAKVIKVQYEAELDGPPPPALTITTTSSTPLPPFTTTAATAATSPALTISNGEAKHWEQSMMMLRALKEGTIATFFGSIASMFVAAVCTLSLIILSRRATLRQVNARLAEISAQLKTLGRGK